MDSIIEVLDQRAAEVVTIRNQLGMSIVSLISLSSHLGFPSADSLWVELKQRHVEELEAKGDAAVAAKDTEIAVLTLSRNTAYRKLSERDTQIATQAKEIAGLNARFEQAARVVENRHAARTVLGMVYDTSFHISHLYISLFSSISLSLIMHAADSSTSGLVYLKWKKRDKGSKRLSSPKTHVSRAWVGSFHLILHLQFMLTANAAA